MKRILTLLLVLALSVAAFTSCAVVDTVKGWFGGEETPTPNVPDEPEVDANLQSAYDFVHQIYKEMKNTAGNYDLITSVSVEGVAYPVTWSVDVESITLTDKTDEETGAALKTVNVPKLELGDPAISYKLTFVVTNTTTKETMTRTYDLVVPEFKISTPAQYYAAEKGTAIAVQGIVTGIMSKSAGDKENSIFVQDATNEGGYYIYALAADPAEAIQLGMTVLVKGDKDIYNGTHEIKNATVEIIDQTIKTVEPIDFTEIFTNAKNTSAEELIGKQGVLVTVKGVTVLNAGSNGYYNWTLGGKNSYLRISSSSNPTTAEQETTIKANHAANFYNKADVTGIITVYNQSFYLMPISENAFSNFVVTEKPDDLQVNYESGSLGIIKEIVVPGAVTLPTTGASFKDVAVSWALAETTNATLAGNVLTPVLPESEAVTITLTATFTKGEETATKEYTVTIKPLVITSITDANEIAKGQSHDTYTADKYIVEGIIKEFKSDLYGNCYITDADGNTLYVYGIYTADGVTKYGDMTGDKPKVGDTVRLLGVLGTYNTDHQMKSGWLLSWSHNYKSEVIAPTCKDDGYTTHTCACGATYTDNVVEKGACNYDENGVCTACGIKNHEHTTVAGTIVAPTCIANGYTVYTCSDEACAFTENKDVKEATGVHADANSDYKCDTDGCTALVLPAEGSTLTIAEALKIGALYKNTSGASYTTGRYYITGWITSISSTKYGTCIITDGTDSINVYGLKDNTGTNRYEYLQVKPVAFDTVKIYGKIGAYYSDVQMDNSNIIEHTAHVCSEYTEATCKKLAKCVICGKETGDYAEHTMVDGKCSVCGHEEGAAEVVPVTVSKTMAELITANGWTDSTTKQSFTLDEVVSVKIDGGANTGKAYNGDHIRIYATDSPAGTMTISVAQGYELVSIKITTQTGTYAFLQVDGGNGSDISNVSTDVSGSSVLLNSVKNGTNGKQVRVTAIEVVYKAVA